PPGRSGGGVAARRAGGAGRAAPRLRGGAGGLRAAAPLRRAALPDGARRSGGPVLIRYLDASALAKRYVEEPGSQLVRERMQDAILATSRLSEVEVTSALVRRWRQGDLSQAELD